MQLSSPRLMLPRRGWCDNRRTKATANLMLRRRSMLWFLFVSSIFLTDQSNEINNDILIDFVSPRDQSVLPLSPEVVLGSIWIPNLPNLLPFFILKASVAGHGEPLVWNMSLNAVAQDQNGILREFMLFLPVLPEGNVEILFEASLDANQFVTQRYLTLAICTPSIKISAPRCFGSEMSSAIDNLRVDFELEGGCETEMMSLGATSILLDGIVVGRTAEHHFQLPEISAGTHELTVVLHDPDGRPAANGSLPFAAPPRPARAAALVYHSAPLAAYKRRWVDAAVASVLAQTLGGFDVLELDYSGAVLALRHDFKYLKPAHARAHRAHARARAHRRAHT